MLVTDYPFPPDPVSVTITGGTTSGAADLGGCYATGLQLPASLAGTIFKFLGSVDGSTFQNIINSDGTDYSITVASSKNAPLDPTKFYPWRWIKIVSDQPETSKVVKIAVGIR